MSFKPMEVKFLYFFECTVDVCRYRYRYYTILKFPMMRITSQLLMIDRITTGDQSIVIHASLICFTYLSNCLFI